MVDVKQSLECLRDKIATVIADLETWNTLHQVQDALELPMEETEGLGKLKYLRKVTTAASDSTIISAAQQMISNYPGTHRQLWSADKQFIQDNLWWIENRGIQQISNVCRYRIVESLEGKPFWGRFTFNEFFDTIVLLTGYGSIPQVENDGYLYVGCIQPKRISITDYLRKLGLAEWPDQRFCLLVERLVHPEVQPPHIQKAFLDKFNKLLQQDDFELRAEGSQGGLAIYKVRPRKVGVTGIPKYIIFASTGSKPDIVIDDAVNMDIRVVRHADKCLIYDQPPPSGDLTWLMLVEWWSKLTGESKNDEKTRINFGKRLKESLQSEPERFLFATYFKAFKPSLKDNLPALLPQVFLHYDPRMRGERSKPVLVRQRMDFLMLLRNAARIVIEIDGIQHYADEHGRASPSRYAEMVAEDRRIRCLGYEVYRFGGAEIVFWDEEEKKFVFRSDAHKTVVSFFQELLARHGIHTDPENF